MENSVWNKLSSDLQILVLLWLPPLDLRRISFTCKYFRSLLSDPSFAIHYDRNRLTDPAFLLGSLHLEKRMQKTALNSFIWRPRRNAMFLWQSPLFDHLPRSHWWSSSYSDGFVCFQGFLTPLCNEKYKLLVFNPLFPHESKILTLPAASDSWRDLYTAIAFDRKVSVCKLIFWRQLGESRIITGVYNFKEGTWKTITKCNGSGKEFTVRRCAQLVDERFFCSLCTDLISSVKTVLVFDVEEEKWKEPIPLPNEYYICIGTHEKELYVLSKTFGERKMKFGLRKFDMEQRVWGVVEFIPPPTTEETDYRVRGGPGFLWVEEWDRNRERNCKWFYDISRHCWQSLGQLGTWNAECFEASLFRFGV